MPELPTRENESGLWQTPCASDTANRKPPDRPHITSTGVVRHIGKNGKQSQCRLSQMAKMWPTPRATDGDKGQRTLNGAQKEFKRGKNLDLGMAVKLWPTPKANDPEKRGNFDANNPRNGLPAAVRKYPTPTSSMMTLADMEQARYSGDDPERPTYQEAKRWPTPIVRDSRTVKGGKRAMNAIGSEPLICQVAETEQVTSGRLNPTWVEWLMGWPMGWTDLKPLETAKFQQWLRWHGEL